LTHRNITPEVINTAHPWAYFDGSAQEAGCGGWAILHMSKAHVYKIKMGLGRGTNNYAELAAANNLILFALSKNYLHLQLFEDSKIICNWINKKTQCNAYSLKHIFDETLRVITYFDVF